MGIKQTYLGDGLYASYDGEYVWLSCDRDNRENRVALDGSVFAALVSYVERLKASR